MTGFLSLIGGLLGKSSSNEAGGGTAAVGEITQNPTVTVDTGDSSDIAGLLQGVASITQVADSPSGGTLNLLNSNSSSGNSTIGATLNTPVGDVSTSLNVTTILIVVGVIAVVIYFVRKK
jgi:hypothetical protein